MSAMVVLCTCPDAASAAALARALVDERLAACVNRIAGVTSTYRWQGAVCEDAEQLLVIKSTRARFAALQARIVALHPAELPEIIAVDTSAGLDCYLAWIEAETTDAG